MTDMLAEHAAAMTDGEWVDRLRDWNDPRYTRPC